jgi:competence protein ComEC
VLLGEPLQGVAAQASRTGSQKQQVAPALCRAGMHWRWDDVEFSILHPAPTTRAASLHGNNRSCVLQVRAAGATILLPGDIERTAEYALHDRLAPVDILLAPHHGSRTSSTATFVAQVQPRHVVFSTGYRNRFGHPHPAVVERYVRAGAQLSNTADSGAITIDIRQGRVVNIERWREQRVHYWQGG